LALNTVKQQYDVLTKVSMDNLLPSLFAKQVITDHEKQIMEKTKPLDSDKMMYLLDYIIMPSLKVNVGIKYNGFLEVMKHSDDLLAQTVAKHLGKHV